MVDMFRILLEYIGIHPREMYSKHLAESVAERTRIRTEYIKIRTKYARKA